MFAPAQPPPNCEGYTTIESATSAIQATPRDATSYTCRAQAYAAANNPAETGDAFAHYLRGLSHSRLGHRDEAIRDLQRALQLTKDTELQTKIRGELTQLGA